MKGDYMLPLNMGSNKGGKLTKLSSKYLSKKMDIVNHQGHE
jgi:hypothetical protein